MEKKIFTLIFSFLIISLPVSAETIVLKSGKKVEGKIIEKTDKYMKLDFQGVSLTYYLDEIDSIEGLKADDLSAKKEDLPTQIPAINSSHEGTAKAYVDQGIAYRMNGNHKEAIACFDKAIEIYPNYAEAYECRGMSYGSSQIGNYDQALADYNKAIEIDPNNKDFYFGRALAYYYKQNYDKAWDDVHKAENMGFEIPPGFIDELKKVSEKGRK